MNELIVTWIGIFLHALQKWRVGREGYFVSIQRKMEFNVTVDNDQLAVRKQVTNVGQTTKQSQIISAHCLGQNIVNRNTSS